VSEDNATWNVDVEGHKWNCDRWWWNDGIGGMVEREMNAQVIDSSRRKREKEDG